jgi:hypothetical protein
MKQGKGRLRDQMPTITAFIDELRAVFGKEGIDQAIARGMRGEPDQFYASENGITIGTPFTGHDIIRGDYGRAD